MSGILDHSQAEIIGQLLLNLDLGADIAVDPDDQEDWPIYVVSHDDRFDALICVFSTVGRLQDQLQINGQVQEFFGIQIKVRSTTISTGYTKAKSIVALLDPYDSDTTIGVGGGQYIVYAFTRTSPIVFIGYQPPDNLLPIHTVNYTVSIRQIS